MKKLQLNKRLIGILALTAIVLISAAYVLSTAPKEYVYSGDLTSGQIYDASSQQTHNEAKLAFDNNKYAPWMALDAGNNQWVSVKFNDPKHIGKLTLYFTVQPGNANNFKLQGYSYNKWEDVYVGVCENKMGQWQTFEFENKKDYSQYRVLVIDTYPAGSTSTISIAEIQMIEIDTKYDVFGKIWTLDGKRT